MNEPTQQKSFINWRLNAVYWVIAFVFIFYVFRLFNLQILRGDEFRAQAEENRKKEINLPTQRGLIMDRNDFILASNVPSYNVVITPANLPEDEGAIQEIFRQLSSLVGVPVSKGNTDPDTVRNFSPCISDLGITQVVTIGDSLYPYSPIAVKCNVDEVTAKIIMEKTDDWPGVGIQVEAKRDYPTGVLTSEVIGFLGPIPAALQDYYEELGFVSGRDKVGYAGVEYTLQEMISGKNGLRVVEVDGAGKEIRDISPPVDPVQGDNVRLTIDTRLQSVAKEALKSEMEFWNSYSDKFQLSNGVVIALNPKTGEILALVSYPTYENNRMARLIPADYYNQLIIDPNRPLFNHAVSAEHPPGSVFKLAAALGILNEGVVTPEMTFNDPGEITITEKYYENDPGTPRRYVCWERAGHGDVDYLHGLSLSCDVYWYKVGGGYEDEVPDGGLGAWRLSTYAKALGYGTLTGIELPGESKGMIPDPTWKRINIGENWSTGDTYISTIGQGYVLATPLQVLQSIAIIANNGKMMKPTLIKDVLSPEGKVIQEFEPQLMWDITVEPRIVVYDGNIPTGEMKTVPPWIIQLAKDGMRMVVTEGTAAEAFIDDTLEGGVPVLSAGKTGTAEYCDNLAQAKDLCKPGNWPAHAWYVGYAPYDDPEIVVVAFVYGGTEGSKVAAPVVRKVIDAYFEMKSGSLP